ncbi:MAG: hypothetical protein IJ113_08530 [Eggerthellaceae bacterium]|nr:hypothetical protein [Eggerthellaceae bacterium]
MTKPKPKPKNALDAVRLALQQEEGKRPDSLKPIEVVKVAFCAYQAYSYAPVAQSGTLAESDDRVALRRGTQASMDRLLFNVNYWRSAYEDRIVAACASEEDAHSLLAAISAWNTHTMKLNTLHESQVRSTFERFCPPLVENNRRGNTKEDVRGKGPVADFVLQAKSVAPHLSPDKRAALEKLVADVEAEAAVYGRFKDNDALDALYELLPVWCLQDRIELVSANWWNDADVIQLVANKLSEKFSKLGHAESLCSYFTDMVNEALDGYLKEIDDVPRALREKTVSELLDILEHARHNHPDSETDGYGSKLPAWLTYKEQLIWNIIVCSIYGPQHARPFMSDSVSALTLDVAQPTDDVITSMAKNAYARYLELRRNSLAEAEFEEFEQLPDDLHFSSLERIISFPDKLKTLGYKIVPAASCYPEQRIESFAPSEVEVLAILEHRRWCEERKAAGWRYAEVRNIASKQSPYLTEWENLPERAREWNRCSSRDIPLLLAKEGLAISR